MSESSVTLEGRILFLKERGSYSPTVRHNRNVVSRGLVRSVFCSGIDGCRGNVVRSSSTFRFHPE
jgi:hypothetical protein